MKKFSLFLEATWNMLGFTMCFIGWHDYIFYLEEHKCVGFKRFNKLNIKVRECTCCGKRWIHPSPACGGMHYHWVETDMKEDEIIELKEI